MVVVPSRHCGHMTRRRELGSAWELPPRLGEYGVAVASVFSRGRMGETLNVRYLQSVAVSTFF